MPARSPELRTVALAVTVEPLTFTARLAQSEFRVGEPKAERKERLLAPLDEPFVADRRALIVGCGEHRAVMSAPADRSDRRAVRIALNLRMGQLVFAGREGDRQAP